MDTLISNFFYDAICRLIPGIVVIFLYGNRFGVRAHDALKNSSALLAVCILFIAWFIGATLDTATFAPFVNIPQIAHALQTNSQRVGPVSQQTENTGCKTVNIETDAEKFARVQHIRQGAEIVLFRIMAFISFFTIILPPAIGSNGKPISRWFGGICMVVFSVCWWFGRKLL
jgi:hypothetical protein